MRGRKTKNSSKNLLVIVIVVVVAVIAALLFILVSQLNQVSNVAQQGTLSTVSTLGVGPKFVPAIPGFPIEAVAAGLLLGLFLLYQRRRTSESS